MPADHGVGVGLRQRRGGAASWRSGGSRVKPSAWLPAILKVAKLQRTSSGRWRPQHHAGADQKHHTVSDLSYAGYQGGIVCHIVPPEEQEVPDPGPRAMPLAAAIADYQKHRVKKLKKQGRP
jgi:hypothetical protein